MIASRWIAAAAFCVATASPACSAGLPFRVVEAGLGVWSDSVALAGGRVAFLVVRVQAPRRVDLALPGRTETNGLTLGQFAASTEVRAALSGGFLRSYYPPLATGMVKADGRPATSITGDAVLNGVLVVSRSGAVGIKPLSSAKPDSIARWAECLQAGPILALSGKPQVPGAAASVSRAFALVVGKSFSRAFVARDARGRVFLGRCSPVSLTALAEFLTRPEASGGLGCSDAINLSGGGSDGLLIRRRGRDMAAGDVGMFLANAIVVR